MLIYLNSTINFCTQILSWNQPVLSNKSIVSCSRKQREPLMGLKVTKLLGHIAFKAYNNNF